MPTASVRALVTFVVVTASLFACAAPTEGDDVVDLAAEDTGQVSSALANTGGGTGSGLTAKECTDCGCSLVLVDKTDQCKTYKCVCSSTRDAECAGGKALMVTEPVTSPTKAYTFGTYSTGTLLFAQ